MIENFSSPENSWSVCSSHFQLSWSLGIEKIDDWFRKEVRKNTFKTNNTGLLNHACKPIVN